MKTTFHKPKRCLQATLAAATMLFAAGAFAYDGTNCKEDGNCWEPKPGYPAKIEGTEFDPKHDPNELNKQSISITEMERRNALRVAHFKRTGKFEYDVRKIEGQE